MSYYDTPWLISEALKSIGRGPKVGYGSSQFHKKEDEMNKKEEVEEYLRTHAVNCETEEEAKELLNFLHNLGFKWRGGFSLKDSDNEWDEYQEDACYSFVQNSFGYGFGIGDIEDHSEHGYIIVDFETFKELFIRKFKPGDKVRIRRDLTVAEMNDFPKLSIKMLELANERDFLTVYKIYRNGWIVIKEDENPESLMAHRWNPDWFELVEPAEEYKEYTVEELEERLGEKIKIKGKVR